MTVCASHVAFGNFGFKRSAARDVYHPADIVGFLPPNMIEFQHDRIGLAAVDARMIAEIVVNQRSIAATIADLPFVPATIMFAQVCDVMFSAIDALTVLAIGRQCFSSALAARIGCIALCDAATRTDLLHAYRMCAPDELSISLM
ncbi:MAG TPA: hypothetical protein VFF60_08890 [Candidatus Binatus sp.]|nr:hypothetical protein [Candidatus Binatus sp.]